MMSVFRTARISSAFFFAVLCSAFALSGCSHGVFSSPEYLAVTISPRPASVPAGGTVVLSGAASNNLSVPTWSLVNAADTASAGSLTAVSGKPNSILYTAPNAAPLYAGVSPAFTQGTVTIQATVVPPPGSASLPNGVDSVTLFITTASISVGLSPAAVGVGLGQTQFFAGYAVGSINNTLIWEVNGVVGGSSTTGTITTAGTYTAPAVLPITGNTITVTIISQADTTKTASATVSLF